MVFQPKIAVAALLAMGLTPAALAQGTAIKERYSVKVRQSRLSPAEFTLRINGEIVGTYADNADVDLTPGMRKGKNTIVVTWRLTTKRPNSFGKTVLTIGVYRNGKWNTAMNVTASKASPLGTRTSTLNAR